jgi:hypothetical protein
MRPLRTALVVAACAAAVGASLAVGGPAGAHEHADLPRAELAQVRAATHQYHDVDAAVADGYVLLDVCFASDDGGMGYHYLKGVEDGLLDPSAPEALVYAPTSTGLKLVAVEYIVPYTPGSTAPSVLGQPLHHNTALGLWVLHAWIWHGNPAGVLADYNPNLETCTL